MAGGLQNSTNTSFLSNKDLDDVFFEYLDSYEAEHPLFTKHRTSTDRYIKEGEMAGLGPLQYKPEGQAPALEALKQGNTKTITFKDYALESICTEQSKRFDKRGVLRRIPEFLGKSAMYSREITAIELLTDAIAGTYRTAIDGQPLLDDTHTILNPWTGASSATFDNLLTAQALGASAITEARDYFEELKNSLGLPAMMPGQIVLFVPTGLRDTAKLHLENEMEVDSADRNLNLNKDAMTYKVLHFLPNDSTAYYFIHTGMNPLMDIVSKGFESRMFDDPHTDNTIYKIVGAWAFDFYSAYPVCGSAGA